MASTLLTITAIAPFDISRVGMLLMIARSTPISQWVAPEIEYCHLESSCILGYEWAEWKAIQQPPPYYVCNISKSI